ncbi:MAG: hypothetical protein COZ68_02270 [Deltaproteobacteria bacterium CG_4_8_14_3_um_filter_43_13]|nr:MAG: hypothetical protein COZ68_02270 [Deltaproteobacteria bacterium CG_4_8_14_3_um_filter_43_13]
MRKSIRNVEFSFEDPTLTHYGGMFIFQRFCRKLELRRILQRSVCWKRRTSIYHPADLILAILYTMIAGMRRISDTRILHYNNCFQSLLGMENFPQPSTLREFLKSLTPSELKGIIRVHDLLRQKMIAVSIPLTSLIFDLDSTVLPVFGWQIQGAKIGYNPAKRFRPSYYPVLCFEGHTRDSWYGVLRPGNTQPVTIAPAFWAAVKKKIPKYLYRIRMRADSGFYDHKFIELLDAQGIEYAIVADMTAPVKEKIQSLRYHTFRKGGWQAAQFTYQPYRWERPHRFIVVRRPKPESQEEELQLRLWKDRDYFYQVFISNLILTPEGVWHFYKKRARVELDIRELKESFPLGKIPTNSFLANEIHFHLTLLGYDLVNWFRRFCLAGKWRYATLETLHRELLVLPARLVHSGRKNQLKLPPGYIHQKLFYQAIKKIEKISTH